MPRDSLATIYKSFIQNHLDYAEVKVNKPNNATFANQIKSAPCNAALAITETSGDASKEKLYQEIGLETTQERRWFDDFAVPVKLFTIEHRVVFLVYYKILQNLLSNQLVCLLYNQLFICK